MRDHTHTDAFYAVTRAFSDPFFPEAERDAVANALLRAWSGQMGLAIKDVTSYLRARTGTPELAEIDAIAGIFSKRLSGSVLEDSIATRIGSSVEGIFRRAGREVEAESVQDGYSVLAKKAGDSIIVVDGVSEDAAIEILQGQLTVAAGGFWDDQLSDSIKNEMLKIYTGDITRDDLRDKLKEMVNKRLSDAGEKTLSNSYFERLANFTTNKVRNIGKFSRGKSLGGKWYTLRNPMDERTSPICRGLVNEGKRYLLADAEPFIMKQLAAESVDDMKDAYPFWKTPSEDRIPIPGLLHFGDCRTTMRIEYLP